MMDVIYLVMTGKKKNILLVSYSSDNAEMLLRPYKNVFEQNERLRNDYGDQVNFGNWKEKKFVLNNGAWTELALPQNQKPVQMVSVPVYNIFNVME